ncbi:hypothetical protein SISNIDRAFT_470019 [Sistotremastrum niveocremeum HHB9708]|uniref:DUF6533 domain-containing protein n=1 Tax=Sistotremastrum niveocremeum HHB9708 TaxID=1314777 RepID=A0A164PBL1_9AGAM|nr:hypothetical protein SISNIDRAFT_470019 [Sistotremastrum niveocremeum HHB9708]
MAAEINAIISYAAITRSTKTCFVAGFCLSFYDIFQTFPEEVEYYWNARWNVPRAFYFLTRYSPVVIELMEMLIGFVPVPDTDIIPPLDHRALIRIFASIPDVSLPITLLLAILDCIFLIIVSAILIICIHALYADRRILWGLILLLFMVGTCIFVLSILGVSSLQMRDELVPGVRFCASISSKLLDKLNWTCWIPLLSFDTVLALLAAMVAWRHRGSHQEHSALLKTLLKGSFAYFLAIVGVAIITVVIERVALSDCCYNFVAKINSFERFTEEEEEEEEEEDAVYCMRPAPWLARRVMTITPLSWANGEEFTVNNLEKILPIPPD